MKLTGKVSVTGYDDCTANKSKMSIFTGSCVPGAKGCQPGITNLVPPDNLTGNGNNTGVTQYDPLTGLPIVTNIATGATGSTGQGSWPYDVDQIISQYKGTANSATLAPWKYPSGGCSGTCKVANQTFGTFPTDPVTGQPEATAPNAADGTPQIVYVPGDLKLNGNATGDGLLIVDGDLTINGGLQYYGLILVKGSITFTGGGTQPVNLFGAILAGDNASASDAVGGSFDFHYSSCALKQTAPETPPKLLATHEVIF
jgi:hypothetical protein